MLASPGFSSIEAPDRSTRSATPEPTATLPEHHTAVPVRTITQRDLRALAAFNSSIARYLSCMDRQARHHHVTPHLFRLLLAMYAQRAGKDTGLNELADYLMIQPPSASSLVEAGVQQGLLTRQESAEDRRRVRLLLTKRGHEVVQAIVAASRLELSESALAVVSAAPLLAETVG